MTQAGMPLTGDFEIISEVVRQQEGEFAARGFEFSEVVWEGSPKLRRYPVFKFRNRRTGMMIDIAFFPASAGRNGGFVVTIIKPVNHVLNVKDYLKLHKNEEPTRFFTYRDPNTDVRSFAREFFQTFVGLMHKELAPILEGRVWEDTPIDWMGYK